MLDFLAADSSSELELELELEPELELDLELFFLGDLAFCLPGFAVFLSSGSDSESELESDEDEVEVESVRLESRAWEEFFFSTVAVGLGDSFFVSFFFLAADEEESLDSSSEICQEKQASTG